MDNKQKEIFSIRALIFVISISFIIVIASLVVRVYNIEKIMEEQQERQQVIDERRQKIQADYEYADSVDRMLKTMRHETWKDMRAAERSQNK